MYWKKNHRQHGSNASSLYSGKRQKRKKTRWVERVDFTNRANNAYNVFTVFAILCLCACVSVCARAQEMKQYFHFYVHKMYYQEWDTWNCMIAISIILSHLLICEVYPAKKSTFRSSALKSMSGTFMHSFVLAVSDPMPTNLFHPSSAPLNIARMWILAKQYHSNLYSWVFFPTRGARSAKYEASSVNWYHNIISQ